MPNGKTGSLSSGMLPRSLRVRIVQLRRWVWQYALSSLTRRILVLNLAGLAALLFGILYLNQFRAGLIEARVQSLLIQGEIIAGAISASATIETDTITIDPDKLAEEYVAKPEEKIGILEFSINPEKVAPVLRRLVTPARLRARIYDSEGQMVLDSRYLLSRSQLLTRDARVRNTGVMEDILSRISRLFGHDAWPRYQELGAAQGRSYPEVAQALDGQKASVVRVNDKEELIVSVAVPVQRYRTNLGALLLSTQGGDIDSIVHAERMAMLRVFMVAAAVMIVLSILLAGTIAGPVRRLAEAAERVKRGSKEREEIPDFTSRHDEIGHLSVAIRDMTEALYDRIEAIERFAADVSHELKNPLTSLRSAVETLPLARSDESRARLIEIVQHDVKRLDRLISDISDASRLDAELQRTKGDTVDIAQLLEAVVAIQNDVRREGEGEAQIRLTLEPSPLGAKAFQMKGQDSRIGQVIANLLGNAKSFSPPHGEIRVTARRDGPMIAIIVDDDGPGIHVEPIARIFERFYTDRPETSFGNNSGLGLSISKQIVEAHHGTITATNRSEAAVDGTQRVLGARFIVRLPAS